MKRLLNVWVLVGAAALLSACTHAPAETTIASTAAPETVPETAATSVVLHHPLPDLYTAGQPAASDWAPVRALGVTTVINLRAPGELSDRDEAAEVQAAGMQYVSIPVASADDINDANAKRLHDALNAAPGGVLVHCASSNRAGALLGLEQATYAKLPKADAIELGRKAGMKSLETRLQTLLDTK